MKKLFIHIGTPKTGTSALQWFFYQNRSLLKKRGITYPEFGLVDDCHHRFGSSFYKPEERPYYISFDNTSTLEEYANMIKAVEGDVLISSELLAHGHFASQLHQVLGDVDVRVVVYLRRQDSLLESWYNQEVKLMSGEDIYQFYERSAGLLDYRKGILEGWSREWGVENVIVRTYEAGRFSKRNIFSDFVEHVFGWELSEDFILPQSLLNPGLLPEVLEYKRAVNNLPLVDEVKCLLATPLTHYSMMVDQNRTQLISSHTNMTYKFRKQVLEHFKDSNAWVARNFLGREDGCLFADLEQQSCEESQLMISPDTVREITLFLSQKVPDLYSKISKAIEAGLTSEQATTREASELLNVGIL